MSTDQTVNDLAKLEHTLRTTKETLFDGYRSSDHEVIEDYTLLQSNGKEIRLSELFGTRDDLIIVHNMGKSCGYCTMWADGFNGLYDYLNSRAAFVVCSPDSPDVQREFADERDWTFPMVSADGSSFIEDLGFKEDDRYRPGVSTFYREDDGTIKRVASRRFGPFDDYNPVWNLFGILRDGVDDWQPGSTTGGD